MSVNAKGSAVYPSSYKRAIESLIETIRKNNYFCPNLQNKEKETEQRLVNSPLHISLRELRSVVS